MERKRCPLLKGGQLDIDEKNNKKFLFFCIIIQRKVINLRNTTNNCICESASSNITDWNSINWNKAEKYVDKQQKRIYGAEVNKK